MVGFTRRDRDRRAQTAVARADRQLPGHELTEPSPKSGIAFEPALARRPSRSPRPRRRWSSRAARSSAARSRLSYAGRSATAPKSDSAGRRVARPTAKSVHAAPARDRRCTAGSPVAGGAIRTAASVSPIRRHGCRRVPASTSRQLLAASNARSPAHAPRTICGSCPDRSTKRYATCSSARSATRNDSPICCILWRTWAMRRGSSSTCSGAFAV